MALSETELVRVLLAERGKLLAYVLSIVHDRHLAEDVFQEVSLLAVQKREEIECVVAVPTWLYKAARLLSLAAIRQCKKALPPFSNEVLDGLDAVWARQQPIPQGDMADALEHCVGQLSPRSQQIIALRYEDNLRSGEVAQRLKSNRNTIYMALSRIHRTLHECIQRQLAQKGHCHG